MNRFFKMIRSDRDVASLVGRLLRTGVITASVIAFIGGVIYLAVHGAEQPRYTIFNGAPANLRHLRGILDGVLSLNGPAVIQLGVVVLLATPILRIFLSAIAFAMEKDYLYVVITLIVLAVICVGMIGGLGG